MASRVHSHDRADTDTGEAGDRGEWLALAISQQEQGLLIFRQARQGAFEVEASKGRELGLLP